MGRLSRKDIMIRDENLKKGLSKCLNCNELKNIKEFAKDCKRYGGIRGVCKSCDNIRKKKYVEDNPNCLNCGREFNDTVTRSSNLNCKDCRDFKMIQSKLIKDELLLRRGDIKEHNKKVKYFINKIRLNKEEFTIRDLSELIDLYELTFVNRISCEEPELDEMYRNLEKYSDKLSYKKHIIDLRW